MSTLVDERVETVPANLDEPEGACEMQLFASEPCPIAPVWFITLKCGCTALSCEKHRVLALALIESTKFGAVEGHIYSGFTCAVHGPVHGRLDALMRWTPI